MGDIRKLTEQDILRIWDNSKYEIYPDRQEYERGHKIVIHGISERCYLSISEHMVFMYAEKASSEEINKLITLSRLVTPRVAGILGTETIKWNVTAEVLKFMRDNNLANIIGTMAHYKFEGTPDYIGNVCYPGKHNYCDLINNLRSTMMHEGCYNKDMEIQLSNKIKEGILGDSYFGIPYGSAVPIHGELKMVQGKYMELHGIMACTPFDNVEYNGKLIRCIADYAFRSGYELHVSDAKLKGLKPKQYKDMDCRLIGRWWVVTQNL